MKEIHNDGMKPGKDTMMDFTHRLAELALKIEYILVTSN